MVREAAPGGAAVAVLAGGREPRPEMVRVRGAIVVVTVEANALARRAGESRGLQLPQATAA